MVLEAVSSTDTSVDAALSFNGATSSFPCVNCYGHRQASISKHAAINHNLQGLKFDIGRT
jgi:hypothetical protein